MAPRLPSQWVPNLEAVAPAPVTQIMAPAEPWNLVAVRSEAWWEAELLL
jgi:hypothetical protein